MLKVGEVVAVDEKNCRVRVKLKDCDDVITWWLPVLVNKTQKDKFYFLPDVGELVLCAFLDSGIEEGFVLGAIYNQKDLPPVSNKDKFHIKFKDGTSLEYDRKEKVLQIKSSGKLKIVFNTGEFSIETCQAEGNTLKINFSSAQISVKNCQTSGNSLIIGHDVIINGELIVNKNITGMQNITGMGTVAGSNVLAGGGSVGLLETYQELVSLETRYSTHTHIDSKGGPTSPPTS